MPETLDTIGCSNDIFSRKTHEAYGEAHWSLGPPTKYLQSLVRDLGLQKKKKMATNFGWKFGKTSLETTEGKINN